MEHERKILLHKAVKKAFAELDIKKKDQSSALGTDLLRHADTRMVETTYARTRHEGVMKQRQAVENLNSFL